MPTLHELDGGERVIYCSSFTKTIAPGVRTGYLVAARSALVEAAGRAVREHPHRPEHAGRGDRLRRTATRAGSSRTSPARPPGCGARRDAMEAALREHFPDGIALDDADAAATSSGSTCPTASTRPTRSRRPIEQGVPYVKGADFFAARGRPQLGAAGLQRLRHRPDRRGHRPARRGARLGRRRDRRAPGARRVDIFRKFRHTSPRSEEERVAAAGRARSRVSLRDCSGWPPSPRGP